MFGGILKDPSDLIGFLKSYRLWRHFQSYLSATEYLGPWLPCHCAGSSPHLLLTEHGNSGFVKLPLASSLLDLTAAHGAEVLLGPCIVQKTHGVFLYSVATLIFSSLLLASVVTNLCWREGEDTVQYRYFPKIKQFVVSTYGKEEELSSTWPVAEHWNTFSPFFPGSISAQ